MTDGAAADRGRGPPGVRTRHGRTIGTPLLGIIMRIWRVEAGLAPHVGVQPETARRRDRGDLEGSPSSYPVGENSPDVTAAVTDFCPRRVLAGSGAAAFARSASTRRQKSRSERRSGSGSRGQGRLIAESRQGRVDLPPTEPPQDRRSLPGSPRLQGGGGRGEVGLQPGDGLLPPARPGAGVGRAFGSAALGTGQRRGSRGLEAVPRGRVGRQRRRRGERVGPQAGRRRVGVPGEGDPGEFRDGFSRRPGGRIPPRRRAAAAPARSGAPLATASVDAAEVRVRGGGPGSTRASASRAAR